MSMRFMLIHGFAFVPGSADNEPGSGDNFPLDSWKAADDLFWLFLLAIALWSVAMFLLYQSIAFQRWVTAEDKKAPDPSAGVAIAWLLSVAILALWFWRWVTLEWNGVGEVDAALVQDFFTKSRDFALAPLVASIPPAAIALFKFSLAGAMPKAVLEGSSSRSPLAASVAALFAVLQLASSVVTLVVFFR